MTTKFTTESVPLQQQLDYWRDAICSVFIHLDIETVEGRGSGFNGRIVQHATGHLNYSEVLAEGHVAVRSKQQISKASEDCFLVLVQRAGESWIEQDGRCAGLQRNEFLLCDSTRPYQMHLMGDVHHQVLKIPGPVLRESVCAPERFTARTMHGQRGAGRALLSVMNALNESTEEISTREAAGIADSLVDLLSVTIGSLTGADTRLPKNIELYHRERVKAVVRERLFDPGLTVDQIASLVNLSSRHLHSLFEAEPMTLSAWIWHERLEAGRRALVSPTTIHRSVTDIAYGVGFKDPAHFSRTFKATYGVAPREFRHSMASAQ